MKCTFLNNTDTEYSLIPPSEQAKTLAKIEYHRETGEPVMRHYFPAGTVLEHPDAWKFVNFGMATAADEECESRIKPMTPEQAKTLQLKYQAAALGIHDKDDLKLFMDGVIAGYEKLPNGQDAYLPGPNWDAWYAENQAKAEKSKENNELEI